jgi:hypothetical protein
LRLSQLTGEYNKIVVIRSAFFTAPTVVLTGYWRPLVAKRWIIEVAGEIHESDKKIEILAQILFANSADPGIYYRMGSWPGQTAGPFTVGHAFVGQSVIAKRRLPANCKT